MAFKCGIVGLPNVGKSLLFNLLTKSQIARSENFPFCTIEPNVAKVALVDKRLDSLSKKTRSKKTIYSFLEFFDIAGLVPGANEGQGLGNKFLSHISQVDSIVMVVRSFQNEEILHHFENINPIRDLEIIELELKCYDINLLEKNEKKAKNTSEKSRFKSIISQIEAEQKVSDIELNLLSSKPVIILCNGPQNQALEDYCKNRDLVCIFVSLDNAEQDILEELVRINFKFLDLITYFTTGPEETRAWVITAGTDCQNASGKIHSDFVKGFIKAEVVAYDKYLAGQRPQVQGKAYIVQDADIIEFKVKTR